jgi:hypothetical protein
VAIRPAAKDAAALEHKPVSFGPLHVAAVIAQRQVQPAIVPGNDSIGAMQLEKRAPRP